MRAILSKTKSETQITLVHRKINSNRREMINELEAFKDKLLTKMPTNELKAELAKNVAIYIKNHEKKLQELEKKLPLSPVYNFNTQKEMSELEYAMDCSIYEFECSIKQKSSLLFISIKHSELEMENDKNNRGDDDIEYKHSNFAFGVLVILDDCVSKEEFS